MRVDTLLIRNFRCFGNSGAHNWGFRFRPQSGTNIVVGPNGSGKTAVLDALELALSADGRSDRTLVSEYDFHDCSLASPLEIEVRLTDVDEALGKFPSEVQWIDPSDGLLTEEKGVEISPDVHIRSIVIRFEAWLSPHLGEIEWEWFLPKFCATEIEPRRLLTRSQHEILGFHRIRPAVSAGAFSLSRYSPLGKHLRRLEYRLSVLPGKLAGGFATPECVLMDLSCEDCDNRDACLPASAGTDAGLEKGTAGVLLSGMAASARSLLGDAVWQGMLPSLGPRYGGQASRLAGLTVGLRPRSNPDQFIPFERLAAGEKYALSFALARAQIPGDLVPVIVMDEPETALYPSGVTALVREVQSAPSKGAPQVFISSHSETVLRCARPADVQVLDKKHIVRNLTETLNAVASSSTDPLSRPQYLLRPGGPNVLLADKVLVVEGPQDALVSGSLDRLAADISASTGTVHPSFASKGWTIYAANSAETVPRVAEILLSLGKQVAVLLDGDSPGRSAAEKTKSMCPTFTYRSALFPDAKLEEALLAGLEANARSRVLAALQGRPDCGGCSKQGGECWQMRGDEACGGRDARKERLQILCLDAYDITCSFPRAFWKLIQDLDSAPSGTVREVDADA